jgi:hypothetical protein
VNREVHARFWESPEVKFLRATRHAATWLAALEYYATSCVLWELT